jgi:hypothetical protein
LHKRRERYVPECNRSICYFILYFYGKGCKIKTMKRKDLLKIYIIKARNF